MKKTLNLPLPISFIFLLMTACSGNNTHDLSQTGSNIKNPLPPCPSSPNCFRTSRAYDISIDTLMHLSTEVLKQMGATELKLDDLNHQIEAVFTIKLFRFKDDMTLKAERQKANSYLHIRSASRKGYSDLGVNKHRVVTFLNRLEDKIPNKISTPE